MSKQESMHASDSSVAVSEKAPAKQSPKSAASRAKKTGAKPAKTQAVYLRRSNGGGGVPKGRYLLILDPAKFGSTGDNWLGGKAYTDRDGAVAAAKKAGVKVANL